MPKLTAPTPGLRQRLAAWLGGSAARRPGRGGLAQRLYQAARVTATTLGFGSGGSTSADAELSVSLERMRSRSRQMLRDSAYAKRAQTVVVNNVIGVGVGMQAQVSNTRGGMRTSLNDAIETAWSDWSRADHCHTGGALHFHDIERLALGEVFTAGEVLIRKHYSAFGTSRVPLALEVIESDLLAGEIIDPSTAVTLPTGHEMRMGVEVDRFQRPVAYYIRQGHPGDVRRTVADSHRYERVPAADVMHLKITSRWPQTRGEPWLHAVLRKIDDMNEYSAAEVMAARASAAYFATIKTPDEGPTRHESATDEPRSIPIEPLTVQMLEPGEELDFHTPNRPNAAMDPFMRGMLREVAAGTGVSYEALSRDYSQSNYSSSRLSLLDDRDTWRVLQAWWVRSFRQPLHAVWLQQAVLAGAVQGLTRADYASDPLRYQAVLFKPRGWSWVDPTKEVNAYREAIKAGLTTLTDVIAATGGGVDIEDVISTRKRELAMLQEAGIVSDVTVTQAMPAADTPAPQPEEADAEDDDQQPAGRHLRKIHP